MGRVFIYFIVALFVAPVVYSIFMAFVPEQTASMKEINSDKTVKTGVQLYQKCAACHGANGDGSEGYPSLNTISRDILYVKMLAFQNNASGSTNAAIMKTQLEGISPESVAKLADYISTLKPIKKQQEKERIDRQKKQENEFDPTNINS